MVDSGAWHDLLFWVVSHPAISYLVIFLIALTESLAVIGLVVPGTVMMLSVGTLIGHGSLSWSMSVVVATLGAIAGDSISYQLGRHFQNRIKTFWPLSTYPQMITRGEGFFHRHGGKSVFLGRFVGPIRPIIPLVAGMFNMSRRYFYCVNVLSAVIWAVVYLFPGVMFAGVLKELTEEGQQYAILAVIVLTILWLSFLLSKKLVGTRSL